MTGTFKKVLLVSLVAGVGMATGLAFWRQRVVAKRAISSAVTIERGLANADFVAARSALPGIADPTDRIAKEREIRVAELQKALTSRDSGMLRHAIGPEGRMWLDPKLLEAADLVLAREALQTRDYAGYQELAGKWRTAATMPGQWVLLEADQLLARKLPEEARQLLESAQLSGPEDALRRARLALLDANEPWKAMASLDAGLKADPRNPDILSFRAQLEEAAGRVADARLDYVAAVLAERKNPLHRDILANFYLRTGDLAAAAETWRDAAEDTSLGVYALKSWFWSRVGGVRLSKPLPPSRQAGWRELIAALDATPPGVFWDVALDAPLAGLSSGSKRPEVVWLKVLEAIRTNDLAAARTKLEQGFPREAERLNPALALRLLVHLAASAGQDPRLPLAGREMPSESEDAHPFLNEFARWANHKNPGDADKLLETWLARPAAIVGTLIVTGWSGAAVIIGQGEQLPPETAAPDWFDYGYAKALLRRDGPASTRKWLETLPARSTAAELLLGEILLTSGAVEPGLVVLQKIAATTNPLASRAAWTLALAELDRGHAAQARQITLASPALACSLQGKELLARIALAEGQRAETLRIYQELGDSSVDAMIFLSKEAFAAGDWAQARKWTAKLAQRFPEQPAFRRNLLQIEKAEKR